MIRIRAENPSDRAAIRRVNEVAFGRPSEANLLDGLAGLVKCRPEFAKV